MPAAHLSDPHPTLRLALLDLYFPAKVILPHVTHVGRYDQVLDPLLGNLDELQVREGLDEEIKEHLYEDGEGRGLEEGEIKRVVVVLGWSRFIHGMGVVDLVEVSVVLEG